MSTMIQLMETADDIDSLISDMRRCEEGYALEGIGDIIKGIITGIINAIKAVVGVFTGGGSSSGGGGGGSSFSPGSKKDKGFSPSMTDEMKEYKDVDFSKVKLGTYTLKGFGPKGEDLTKVSQMFTFTNYLMDTFVRPVVDQTPKALDAYDKLVDTILDVAEGKKKPSNDDDAEKHYTAIAGAAFDIYGKSKTMPSEYVKGFEDEKTGELHLSGIRLLGGMLYSERMRVTEDDGTSGPMYKTLSTFSVRVHTRHKMEKSDKPMVMDMDYNSFTKGLEGMGKDVSVLMQDSAKLESLVKEHSKKLIARIEEIGNLVPLEVETQEERARRNMIISSIKVLDKFYDALISTLEAIDELIEVPEKLTDAPAEDIRKELKRLAKEDKKEDK